MEIKETREEIIRRSKVYTKRRRQRNIKVMQAASGFLAVMLLLIIRQLGGIGVNVSETTNYGSLLLGEEAGTYIIVGLICFILGVLITLIALKKKEHNESDDDE